MPYYVRYLDYPVGAQEDGTAACDDIQSFSDNETIMDGASPAAWATTERNCWKLDGTRRLYTNHPSGWWSKELSDANGLFANAPTITITFTAPVTATGLTFAFDTATGDFVSKMSVKYYNGTTLLSEKSCAPIAPDYTMTNTVESFDKIVIELLQTNIPYHFAKVEQIKIGQFIIIDEDELISVNMVNEVDPSSCEMSVDTMSISFRDKHDRQFAAQANQTVELYVDDNLAASQYIETFKRNGLNSYTIDTQSAIGRLDDDYLGGIYNAKSATDLISDILGDFAFSVDPVLSDATVSGYLPIMSRREALQNVVLAIGAIVSTQGDGTIRLYPRSTQAEQQISNSRIFAGSSLESDSHIYEVDVTAHKYTSSDETEELIRQETIDGTSVLYEFNDPHHDYAISGGTITGSGENWVTITASGEVTLTGKKYDHVTTVYKRQNSRATGAERSNIVELDDATLVTDDNAQDVCDRLYDYLLLEQTLTEDIVANTETAGQMVISANPWDEMTQGYIKSIDTTYSRHAKKASVKIIGTGVSKQIVFGYSGQMTSGQEVIMCLSL